MNSIYFDIASCETLSLLYNDKSYEWHLNTYTRKYDEFSTDILM